MSEIDGCSCTMSYIQLDWILFYIRDLLTSHPIEAITIVHLIWDLSPYQTCQQYLPRLEPLPASP
jgi:hypothetical protein